MSLTRTRPWLWPSWRQRSWAIRHYSKSSRIDLDFLLNNPGPGSHSPGPIPPNARDLDPKPASEPKNPSQALYDLRKAVSNQQFKDAETIYTGTPALHDHPVALQLIIRSISMAGDYTSAKAILVQSLSRVNIETILQFLVICFRNSENVEHLEDVFWRAVAIHTDHEKLAALSGTALLGFLVLQDSARADKVRRFSREKNLLRSSRVLQAALYAQLISGEFLEALELGHVVLARERETAPNKELRFLQDLPYRWALRRYALNGDLAAVETIMSQLKELDIAITPTTTNILLAFLPEQYPDIPLEEWLSLCQSREWVVDSGSHKLLARELVRRYPSIFAKPGSKAGSKSASKASIKPRKMHSPALVVTGKRASADLSNLWSHIAADRPQLCLGTLDDMLRRGAIPPYYFFVIAFGALAAADLRPELDQLISRMVSVGYPRHCAGTDLAMLEADIRKLVRSEEKAMMRQVGLQLVHEYLSQYPLQQHDRIQLTRLGRLFLTCGRPEDTIKVVDSLRSSTDNMVYTGSNHDSVSLQLILRALQAMKAPVLPVVEAVIADKAAIVLDYGFRHTLSSVLDQTGEPKSCFSLIHKHNATLSETMRGLHAVFTSRCT